MNAENSIHFKHDDHNEHNGIRNSEISLTIILRRQYVRAGRGFGGQANHNPLTTVL